LLVAYNELRGDTWRVDWKTIALLLLATVTVANWIYKAKKRSKARLWPLTEATIESGAMEAVAHSRYGDVTLPVFAFSYVVDREYYSGRFALFPYITDPGESIFARMAGRKLQVHYDPRKPAEWFLPEELIEGCKVEQEIGPHWNNYYPK